MSDAGPSGILIARLGDPGTHGGSVITASPDTDAEGISVARVGDIYACPIHGPNPIVGGAAETWVNSPHNAHDGSPTACGAAIIATATHTWTD